MHVRYAFHFFTGQIPRIPDSPVQYRTSGNPRLARVIMYIRNAFQGDILHCSLSIYTPTLLIKIYLGPIAYYCYQCKFLYNVIVFCVVLLLSEIYLLSRPTNNCCLHRTDDTQSYDYVRVRGTARCSFPCDPV
jgi:hypothetical protein